MLQSYFIYLFESSLCLLLFAAFYKAILQRLTFFQWIRYYLIASLILAVIIPLFEIPILTNSNALSITMVPFQTDGFPESELLQINQNTYQSVNSTTDLIKTLYNIVLFCYFLIASYKLIQFTRKILNIKKLISSNKKTKEQNYWIVIIQDNLPAFSFFRYIFLNKSLEHIDKGKFDVIKKHELIHANQLHSLDNIVTEILLIIFWFNPIIYFYKKYIHETHEFEVDEKLTQIPGHKKSYANLLLNLAVQNINISPLPGFSSIQINKRIKMINKQKSNRMRKIAFILTIPLIASMMLSFSFFKNPNSTKESNQENNTQVIRNNKVGEITWIGNSVYSVETLNKELGLEQGDNFSFDELNNCLSGGNISTLYLDNGYVFYKADFATNLRSNKYDLNITIYEGIKGKIGNVLVKGNNSVPTADILNKIAIKSDDLFNKTKIVNSVKAINRIKNINGEKTDVRVLPEQGKLTSEGYGVVDLEFVIAEK